MKFIGEMETSDTRGQGCYACGRVETGTLFCMNDGTFLGYTAGRNRPTAAYLKKLRLACDSARGEVKPDFIEWEELTEEQRRQFDQIVSQYMGEA